MIRRLFKDWRFYVASSLLSVGVSFFWGLYAAAGMALGLIGTFASVLGTWAAVKLMSGQGPDEADPGPNKLLLGFIFLSKLPVFFGSVVLTMRLPDPGLAAFAAGLLLVYCLLVGWAQAHA